MSSPIPDAIAQRLDGAALTAFLATSRDDRPHVAPVWYRYVDGRIEILTTGRKLENIRANPRVSLAIQQADAGIPEWKATLLGTATVIDDEDATTAAIRKLNRKYGADEDAWAENTLVRIEVGSVDYTIY